MHCLKDRDLNLIKILDKEFARIITKEELNKRIDHLAQRINHDYQSKEILFVSILNGAFVFSADLYRKIQGNHRIEFMKASSYKGLKSSGDIRLLLNIDQEDITNKHIIIIEDIVESGNTLSKVMADLGDKGPKSIQIATMFYKPNLFKHSFSPKYIGFVISDEFIIGYGLDYNGYGRNLPDIYQLKL